MTEEPVIVQVTATCHTEDCGNAGIAIPVWVVESPDPHVICGVCGVEITDLGTMQ